MKMPKQVNFSGIQWGVSGISCFFFKFSTPKKYVSIVVVCCKYYIQFDYVAVAYSILQNTFGQVM